MKSITAAVLMIALAGCQQAQPPKPSITWGAGTVTANCPPRWMADYDHKGKDGPIDTWIYCRPQTPKERDTMAKFPHGNQLVILTFSNDPVGGRP